LVAYARVMLQPIHAVLLFSAYDILSVSEKGLMSVLARILGVRVVWSIRSDIPGQAPPGLKTTLMQLLLRSATVVVCQTDGAADKMRKVLGVNPGQIVCIPNWIDCAAYPVN